MAGGIYGQGVQFRVGRILNSLGEAHVDFWPSNTAMTQMNIGVVGDLGTGKTQLLKSLTAQLRDGASSAQATPISMLVFDYKRDFQDEEFLSRVGGKVLRPHHIPLNVFALGEEFTALKGFQRAQAFIDVLAKIYPGIGPVQRDKLVSVITELYAAKAGVPPTMSEVAEQYRAVTKTADSVTGILNTFVLGEIFSDEPEDLLPFSELVDDRVLVVALNELGADQNTKNALVVLFLNQYYEYMLSFKKWPFEGTQPQLRRLNSFLLVDEATNIMKYEFPVLMDLMLQGREFGSGVILASQYLNHFRVGSTNYGEPLRTWFIHKVPSVTLRELKALGLGAATEDQAAQITSLGVHEALCSTLDVPARFIRGVPFYELGHPGSGARE